MYLIPDDAGKICEAIKNTGTALQSKHILVSTDLMETVKEVFDATPEGSSREAYHMRRAG